MPGTLPLASGSRLGSYEILAPLGAGGMGEVYRARDTRLGREVAIKALPAELSRDAERLARFEREAKLLAALNHPGIAAIHGLEEAEGQPVLVLELVPGEDLAERLKRGPIPVDEALEVAAQVAEALEEAHEKGIVHRDLKPANVKVTPDGKVAAASSRARR
jgi:serine/threonine protein kinase